MVDANVWVDSVCVDHSETLAARAFIGQATEAGALLFFPVHIAKDVLYVVQHELKRSVLAGGGALCLLYTSPSPRDRCLSRMPSSA